MARGLRILSVTLITAGLVILIDVGLTLAWKEPLSAIYGTVRQNAAANELETVSDDFLQAPAVTGLDRGTDEDARVEALADLFEDRLETGKPIGRLEIPAIDADYVVVEGTDEAALKRGPGRYPETSLPGQGKTIGIAGHRTTYGAPLRRVEEIDKGDVIRLEMPYGTFTYEVTGTEIVNPDQTEIVADEGEERLVLTTCHPLYSAAQRYAVFAELVEVDPAPAAEPGPTAGGSPQASPRAL